MESSRKQHLSSIITRWSMPQFYRLLLEHERCHHRNKNQRRIPNIWKNSARAVGLFGKTMKAQIMRDISSQNLASASNILSLLCPQKRQTEPLKFSPWPVKTHLREKSGCFWIRPKSPFGEQSGQNITGARKGSVGCWYCWLRLMRSLYRSLALFCSQLV